MVHFLRKTTALIFISILMFACSKTEEKKVSVNEKLLIAYVEKCIALAERNYSKLPHEVLVLEGMSSAKVRHLLNNLGGLPNLNYLEIGSWKGSTWISTLYDNHKNINTAIAIDNWSQGASNTHIIENSKYFLADLENKYMILTGDAFAMNKDSIFSQPVNLYFYDGEHTRADQEAAFTYYNDILDDLFIAVVDDWNFDGVPNGTRDAFKTLNYQILYEAILPAAHNGDRNNWWNGLYVAVIRKPRVRSEENFSGGQSFDFLSKLQIK